MACEATGLPLSFTGALTASSRHSGRVGCLLRALGALAPPRRAELRESSLLRPCSVARLWRATAQALWTISQRIQIGGLANPRYRMSSNPELPFYSILSPCQARRPAKDLAACPYSKEQRRWASDLGVSVQNPGASCPRRPPRPRQRLRGSRPGAASSTRASARCRSASTAAKGARHLRASLTTA